MPTNLPSDEILIESTIAGLIKDVIDSVVKPAGVESFRVAQVYSIMRFPDSDTEDEQITTVYDPVTNQEITSVIEVGVPLVEELEYAGDIHTQLNFTYPITFDMKVFEGRAKDGVIYDNSNSLVKAIYMKSRRAFKNNRTFGYDNCVHNYLQQVSAVIIEDEDTGGSLHAIDWSIEVQATGILV